jgi:hypothetical protein
MILAPVNAELVEESRKLTRSWVSWFTQATNILLSLQQTGTTANRPTSGLWVGRMYFDSTLGYPVWVKSVGASPPYTAVWVNGAGAVV